MVSVCTHEDEFTRGRFLSEPRWLAHLENGVVVLQDDGRPGQEISAWLRLKAYVAQERVRIRTIELQFRSHIERPLPEYAAGYFFRTAVGAFSTSSNTLNHYLLGYLDAATKQIHVTTWLMPALVPFHVETRDPLDEKQVGPSLILQHHFD